MTTVFTKGQGALTISATENIQLAGYKAADLSASMFSRLGSNLVITLDSSGTDKIIVTNYLTDTDSTLTIQFDDAILTSLELDTYIANNTAITIYTGYDGTKFSDTLTAPVTNYGRGSDYHKISGLAGDDTVIGSAKANPLYGNEGNDTLIGNAGYDELFGGEGTDTYIFAKGHEGDKIQSETNANETTILKFIGANLADLVLRVDFKNLIIQVYGDTSDSVTITDYFANKQPITFVFEDRTITLEEYLEANSTFKEALTVNIIDGTSASETITGTEANDIIHSQGGKDIVMALAGDDQATTIKKSAATLFYMASGNDIAIGGDSNDRFYLGAGNDKAQGNNGNDIIYGDDDSEAIKATEGGNDIIYGGNGADQIYGQFGDDILYGNQDSNPSSTMRNSDNDMIDGGDGNDQLFGGIGHDNLFGGAGDDVLNGESGDQYFSQGDDYLSGDWGDDSYVFSGAFGYDVVADRGASDNSEIDVISFTDLNLNDVLFSLNGTNLLISVANNSKNFVEVVDFATDAANHIEQFNFKDQIGVGISLVEYEGTVTVQVNLPAATTAEII
ncbi:hypothetical protein NYR79_04445 [Actinobacillus equuli subsp. haemolyticus]|uniref:calcium-binding protein n=1 Tax=Actinobacillus equuli TaxID=718 RepID=UPI0024429674|nr:calcium-binding protein [Actinobacillus equuli]WGE72121.1 hypothetical protein NYR79_04445 [Actinobacillus equuli subsp. haemolyticus]